MGVITTPAVAFVTRRDGFDAGVVISASHNPYQDNGIKIFMGGGRKSSGELETAIEEEVLASTRPPASAVTPAPPDPALEAHYLEHLVDTLGGVAPPSDLALALDCAQGAGYRVGPRLLERLGLRARTLAATPDGTNINRDCGSTHIEGLAATVRGERLDLGAALDGDGDRLLLVDGKGRLVDGDAILLMCARRLKQEGRLASGGVVATVMSNMALELALKAEGLELHRTPVGDKFVAMEMSERRIIIGGEQSGHIIFSDFASTGDGLLTLVQVLRVLALEGKGLDAIGYLDPFPQVLVNVRVRERPDVRSVPAIAEAIARAEAELDGKGRVLVRYSGTEPLLRIMMEGPDEAEFASLTSDVRLAVERAIGAEA